MRTRICVAVLAAAALFLSGCGSAKRPLSDSEASLLTNGNTTLQFHTSAYHPSGISLGFPGYVMAIDKSPVERVAHNRDEIKLIEIPDAGLGVKVRSSFLNSSIKTFYIAQINEYTGRPYGDGNCTTYNLYYQISRRLNAPQADPGLNPENTANYVAPFTAFVPWCNGEGLPKLKEGLDKDPEKYAANYNWRDWPTANVLEESPYTSSWAALEELRDALAAKLSAPGADYTHIVVVVMGWNTVQTEAYRNFNSLMTNIRANAKKDPGVPYNPLFIGVTWPSSWESGWAEPLVKLLSYPFKAGDADEVGLSWLAALFQEVVFPLKEQHRHLKVVAIGHSFGATSLGLALYVGPVIERNDSEKQPNCAETKHNDAEASHNGAEESPAAPQKADLFIGLQSAFSLNRFIDGEGVEEVKFLDRCKPKLAALTASKHDTAVKSHFLAPMVGDYREYEKQCSAADMSFDCVAVDSRGNFTTQPQRNGRPIYIDANELIRFNAIGTSGGAHSDIYRFETGTLLWELIKMSSTS